VLALRGLEGDEDPAPDLGRVLDGLEPGRDRRPLRMVEVRVMGAGRDDQGVVPDRAAIRERDLALLGIDADGFAEDHGRVAVLAEDRSQRLGNIARRQCSGRDLVQERLEEVEVASIDEGDADLRIDAEVARRVEAREPASDDHDPMRRSGGRGRGGGHASILASGSSERR
jgi:hypothetical protein